MISDPFFLPTPAGRVFAVHHRPAPEFPVRGHVLCVPPFNEEMNRCRSMVTQQATALADVGLGTLVIDLLGTGDSEGDHVDARWSAWLGNLVAAKNWLDAQPGGCRAIWGIRLGALLAAELHGARLGSGVALVMWQPVVDGRTHLTQFLRVRIAASLDRAGAPKESTSAMRAQLAAGQSLEVAGYEIHTELAAAIDGAKLADLPLKPGTHLLWLENATGGQAVPSPGSQRLLAGWPGGAVHSTVQVFEGPAFWQTYERVLAPATIAMTTAWLDARLSAP